MNSSNWLLLQVKPRQEMRALENLERQQARVIAHSYTLKS